MKPIKGKPPARAAALLRPAGSGSGAGGMAKNEGRRDDHDASGAAAAMLGTNLTGADAPFTAVSTDSRHIKPGELFIALRGESGSTAMPIGAGQAAGAAGAIVAADAGDVSANAAPGLPLIAVADTRLALGALAAGWRARFRLPLIAVTGSNGKTTTKNDRRHSRRPVRRCRAWPRTATSTTTSGCR